MKLSFQGLEQLNWGSMMVKTLPTLKSQLFNTNKMDCKPAQNAFKETWAQWLILNEHHIQNKNVQDLEKSLSSVLEQRQSELLQGVSTNFYDHTKQALGRMFLHEANHSEDCGTLVAWDRAISADKAYRAVALYNKAYIIIHMGKSGYMDNAIQLLKETIKCIDVHVAENANTMMACHISSINGKFTPHNDGETNFKRQLEIRNSFFKIWLDYTQKAVEKLQKLKDDGEDAITEEKGIFALIEKPDHLEGNELQELFNEGLQVVYEVQKKPRFCIDALICFLIGTLQVFAGILVCVCSFGSSSQVGLGLISEGVSDMIAGIEGMVKGTFDWAEWAISKAISIGLSLISAGFSKIKDATCAVSKGLKGVLAGTKSLSSVADDCLRAAKSAWTSTKTAISSAAGALSKESLKISVVSLTSSEVAKATIKQAGKYTLQELATQGAMKALNFGISKGTEALFEKILSEIFTKEVKEGLFESHVINDCLVHMIVCYGIPESTLKAENPNAFRISSATETIIYRHIKDICEHVVPELTTDNAVINEVFSRLKEVKNEMEGILRTMDTSGKVFTAATVAAEVGTHAAKFATMVQNIPTQKVLNENVIPKFKGAIEMLLKDDNAPNYRVDGRSTFPTVRDFKNKICNMLVEKISSAFTDACASNLNSFLTDFARSKLNKRVAGAIKNVVGRYETNYFFQTQQKQYHIRKMEQDSEHDATKVSEPDLKDLIATVEKIEDTRKVPTIMELKALVASGELGNKGLEIQVIDKNGAELSYVAFKGLENSTGAIKLRIVREDIQMEG